MDKRIWAKLAPRDLLILNFKELSGLTPMPELSRAITEVSAELSRVLPKMKLSFYPSDEWFCADENLSIAVPFYLYHESLFNLEKKIMGEAFEKNFTLLKKILRHEIGHAVDNAYKLREEKERKQIFGDPNTPYPRYYSRKMFSRSFVRNLPDNYAQAHPDEDFAETFAFWLNSENKWQKKSYNKTCLKKLKYMDRVMREIKTKTPLIKTHKRYEKIREIDMTLKDFYKKKKRIYLSSQKLLQKGFNPMNKKKNFSLKDSHLLTKEISKALGLPLYKSSIVVKNFLKNYPEKNVSKNYLIKHLEKNASNFLAASFERIPL